MQEFTRVDRRTVIRGVGGLALAGALAGCSTNGGDGGDGGDDFTPPQEAVDYVSDSSNYDGFEDMTGQSSVTVDVGVEGNDGFYAFGPPAIRVDAGTTVTWEWTGEGQSHSVVDEDGAFESDLVSEAGHTFEHAFDSAGTSLYFCEPHKTLGMKGAVVVE